MAAAAGAAAQAAADLQDFEACLVVCGLVNPRERNGITNREGIRSLEAFGQFQPEDITDLTKSLRTIAQAQRVYITFAQTKNLETLAFWVQDRLDTNQPLDAALWTPATMRLTAERKQAKKDAPAPSGTVRELKKFDPMSYDESMDLFRNFLKQRDLAQFLREVNPIWSWQARCRGIGQCRFYACTYMY